VQKTARGALIKNRCEGNVLEVVQGYRDKGYQIYALEKHKFSEPLEGFTPRFPCLLILGNEEFGVSVPLLKLSDASLAISLYGAKNSLNVAVAAGIALGHFCRGLDLVN
jgi:tRNA G18 (ribose-2'-O)-methylase SpoU